MSVDKGMIVLKKFTKSQTGAILVNSAILAKSVGALAVLAAGFGVGFYYLGNQGKNAPTPVSSGSDSPSAGTQSANAPSLVRRPPIEAGEYTAPGAPDILIDETPVTSAKPAVATPAAAATPPDSEASQTGLPIPASTPILSSATDGADQNGTSSAASSSTGSPDSSDPSSAPAVTSQPSSAATPLGNQNQNGAASDGSASTSPSSYASTGESNSATGLYHVQAGSFQSDKNAKVLEGALQSKGYAAMTVHQFAGGHDSYVVQVGAYSSSITANQMVGNLQRDGFAASVSHGQ